MESPVESPMESPMEEREEPSFEASPEGSQGSTAQKKKRILACVLCQSRKIKCSRTFPCDNCVKLKTKCEPSTPAPTRKRKRAHHEVYDRITLLEDVLRGSPYFAERIAAAKEARGTGGLKNKLRTGLAPGASPDVQAAPLQAAASPPALAPTPGPHSSDIMARETGTMVQENGGQRLMDSKLLATIFDEASQRPVRDMRDMMDQEAEEDDLLDQGTTDGNAHFLLGEDGSTGTSLERLWPDHSHIYPLWTNYLDRVNPLNKLIHVPTLLEHVNSAAAGTPISRLPKNAVALLFSVFLMAVVAMSPAECRRVTGYTRSGAMQRFGSGCRMALVRTNYLVSCDLTILQALVIYLISLQGRNRHEEAWIVSSVPFRLAIKMGLHRDGQRLGLTPFETEMRRRTWWQMLLLDGTHRVLMGLNNSPLPRDWDTEEPRNINDSDIYPSATDYLEDRQGPTEMVFALLCCKFARLLMDTTNLDDLMMAGTGATHCFDSEERAKFTKKYEAAGAMLLSVITKYSDPSAGPVHRLARMVGQQINAKLREVSEKMQEREQPGRVPEEGDTAYKAFQIAICGLEREGMACHASEEHGFLWHALTHFNFRSFIFVAGQLCERTEGTFVDRAWEQMGVVYQYHPELFDTEDNKQYRRAARLVLAAWDKREQMFLDRQQPPPETPAYVHRLRRIVGTEDLTHPAPSPVTFGQQTYPVGGPSQPEMASLEGMPKMEPFGSTFNPYLQGMGAMDMNMGTLWTELQGEDQAFSDGQPLSNGQNAFNGNEQYQFGIFGLAPLSWIPESATPEEELGLGGVRSTNGNRARTSEPQHGRSSSFHHGSP